MIPDLASFDSGGVSIPLGDALILDPLGWCFAWNIAEDIDPDIVLRFAELLHPKSHNVDKSRHSPGGDPVASTNTPDDCCEKSWAADEVVPEVKTGR